MRCMRANMRERLSGLVETTVVEVLWIIKINKPEYSFVDNQSQQKMKIVDLSVQNLETINWRDSQE